MDHAPICETRFMREIWMTSQDSSASTEAQGDAPIGSIGIQFDVANWKVLTEEPGFVRVEVPLHRWLRNPLGQLFGGFTPSYADMLAYRVARSGDSTPRDSTSWFATTGMRVDYLEPIIAEHFQIECQLLKSRGKSMLTEARFYQGDVLAAFAVTTILVTTRPT
jgi:acyl-coenzyme A thioesterase PaaI-like protein